MIEDGPLGYAVDDAARAAAAENHPFRPFQYFYALEVVEIAKDLRIVAYAIQIKVGSGADAANDNLVAVALALMHEYSVHVTENVTHSAHRLVLHQLRRHDSERGRNVLKRRVGLGRSV